MYTCYELKSDWLKVIQLQVIFSTIKTFSIHVLTVFWNCNIWNCDIEGGTFPISANSRVRDKMDLGLGASEVKDEKIRVMQFWIGSLKIGWFFSQWKYSSLLVFANIRVGSHVDNMWCLFLSLPQWFYFCSWRFSFTSIGWIKFQFSVALSLKIPNPCKLVHA